MMFRTPSFQCLPYMHLAPSGKAMNFSHIKLIATDLDRTLLRADKTISGYTADVLARCRERGVKIVFATARPKNRTEILPFMDLADFVVVSNGAAIFENDRCTAQFGIPEPEAKTIVNDLHHAFPHLPMVVEYGNTAYRDRPMEDGLWEGEVLIGFESLPALPADKIVIHAGSNEFSRVQALLPEDCYAQLCENRLILIMHNSAAKWNATRHIADCRQIPIADIAAFGDDYNDVEMLQNCGAGVSVANGLAQAKAAADFICDSNENDGPAKWIEEHVLHTTKEERHVKSN